MLRELRAEYDPRLDTLFPWYLSIAVHFHSCRNASHLRFIGSPAVFLPTRESIPAPDGSTCKTSGR